MDTTILLACVLAATSVVLVTYGVWSMATAERERVAWRVSRTGIGATAHSAPATDVRVQGRSSAVFAPVDRALTKYTWAEQANLQLMKAEINLNLSEFIAMRLIAASIPVVVAFLLLITGASLIYAVAALVAAGVVYWQTGAYVRRRVVRRQRGIENNLDEALVSLAGSLRAGFSFPQACQMSLNQLQWPLRDEFRMMLEEVNVGASLDDALRNMADRIDSYEMDITVNAVLVQRQIGGSLAEILDNVAHTLRERRELRGHIMALTAQQRLSAYFVAGVPVFMLVLLSLTSWQFMRPLFFTLAGNILIAIGLVMDILGFLVMRRLTKIDF